MFKLEYNTKTLLACAALLLASTFAAFWPGTSGGFLVDDYHNLQPMGKLGGIHSLDNLRLFIFSGESGPTGRPLALLSFAIDAQTWPADPFPFKVTNIFIHALNALLIFALVLKLFQIGRQADTNQRDTKALTIAFITAAAWALHPLHTSTVLYVIQRMVELTTLFMLIGVWCYVYGRQRLATAPGPAYLWMSAAVLICGPLAILCKENGVILPLFILVLEVTLLREIPRPQHWRYWAVPVLGVPTALVFLYLGYAAFTNAAVFATRDFTLYERLLSESRILFDYLGKIALPLNTPTLNHDDHAISTSLFSPFTTILSVIGIIASLVAAFIYRQKYPVISFAILWFLVAHLLESTVLPLELYFEHRNYLAMLGPILAIAYYAQQLIPKNIKIITSVTAVFFIAEIGLTLMHSYTWGNAARLNHAWAEEHPESIRAKSMLAMQLYSEGNTADAVTEMAKVGDKAPEHLGLKMMYASMACIENKLTQQDIAELIQAANTLKPDSLTTNSLIRITRNIGAGKCTQISTPQLAALIKALINNQHPVKLSDKSIANMYVLLSDIYLSQRDVTSALYAIDETFKFYPSMELALKQAYILGVSNQIPSAMTQINKAIALDIMRNPLQPSRREEIEKMRAFIQSKASGQ